MSLGSKALFQSCCNNQDVSWQWQCKFKDNKLSHRDIHCEIMRSFLNDSERRMWDAAAQEAIRRKLKYESSAPLWVIVKQWPNRGQSSARVIRNILCVQLVQQRSFQIVWAWYTEVWNFCAVCVRCVFPWRTICFWIAGDWGTAPFCTLIRTEKPQQALNISLLIPVILWLFLLHCHQVK